MPARVLAVLGAVAMIAGSFAVRSRLDEGEAEAATPLRVICTTELRAVCTEVARVSEKVNLEITIEPAGVTYDRLVGTPAAEAGADAWLTPGAWPQMLDAARERRQPPLPPLFAARSSVAETRVALVVNRERANALKAGCGNVVDWKCVGTAATKRSWGQIPGANEAWGEVKIGHADASKSAGGLAVIAAASTDFLDRNNLSTADFEDPAYADWFSAVETNIRVFPTDRSPLQDMLSRFPASYDFVGALEAEVTTVLRNSARKDSVEVVFPQPATTVEIVLGRAQVERTEAIETAFRFGRAAIFDTHGFVGGRNAPDAVPMPMPGSLEALRRLWLETTT